MIGLGIGLGVASLGTGGGVILPPLPVNSGIIFDGDSITAPNTPYGVYAFAAWTLKLVNGNYYAGPNSNRGVSGQRIDQLLARLPDTLSLNAGAKVYNVMIGVNDCDQMVSASRTAALVIADYQSVIALVRAAGLRMNIGTISKNGGFDAAKEQMRVDINTWIRALNASDIKVFDTEAFTPPVPPAVDTVHPSPAEAYLYFAKPCAANLNAWMDPAATILSSTSPGGNLFPNWTLAGTNGGKFSGVSGSVASSMDVSGYTNGPTVVASKTTLRGFTAQRLVFSGTPTASGVVTVWFWGANFNAVDGTNYEVLMDIECAANPTGVNGIRPEMFGYLLSSNVSVADADVMWGSDTLSGAIRSVPITKVGNQTGAIPMFFYIGFKANAAASLDITFARPHARVSPGFAA